MPPILTEPVSSGLNGSETSYWRNSPVPQQDDVEEPVVQRQVDVGDQRRHGAEALQQRRQQVRVGRLGRNLDHLPDAPTCPLSRYQIQIDADRSLRLMTTPTKP